MRSTSPFAFLLLTWLSVSALADTPAELRRKAIKQLQAGDDNQALATVQKLLSTETPADRGLETASVNADDTDTVAVFDSLGRLGFRLQREPGPPGDAKPADFSFTQSFVAPEGTTYSADFFLGWNPKRSSHSSSIELSAQGKLRTGDSARDAWVFRGNAEFWNSPEWLDGLYTTLGVKDESDFNFNFNRLSAELVLTPSLWKLAIGQFRPIAERDPQSGNQSEDRAKLPPIQFRWRPYFGADVGTWLSDSPNAEDDTSARGFVRVTADIRLNWLAAQLSLKDATLFADETFLITSSAGTHSYLKTGLNLMFNENIGFSLTYHLGEDAPNFSKENALTGALAVQF